MNLDMGVSPPEIVFVAIFSIFSLVALFQSVPDFLALIQLGSDDISDQPFTSHVPHKSSDPVISPLPTPNNQLTTDNSTTPQRPSSPDVAALRKTMKLFRRAPKDTKLKRKSRFFALVISCVSCVIAYSVLGSWVAATTRKVLESVVNVCILFIGTHVVFVFVEMYAKVIDMDTMPSHVNTLVWPYRTIRWVCTTSYLVFRLAGIHVPGSQSCTILIVADVVDVVSICLISGPWLISMVLMSLTLNKHMAELNQRKYREKERINLKMARNKLYLITVCVVGLIFSTVVYATISIIYLSGELALQEKARDCLNFPWSPVKSIFMLVILLYYSWKRHFTSCACREWWRRKQQARRKRSVAIVVETSSVGVAINGISKLRLTPQIQVGGPVVTFDPPIPTFEVSPLPTTSCEVTIITEEESTDD